MPAEVPNVHALADLRRPLRCIPLAAATPMLAGRYVVKGLFHRDSLAVIYGPSGSGKTFLSADLGLHVAAGRPWRNHRVRGGLVAYVAAEGPASVVNRSVAWCSHHGTARNLPFAICPDAVDLVADRDRILDFVGEAERLTGDSAAMVIVDTVSRSFGGRDENSSADMSGYVAALDYLREHTGACIVAIHHSGKDMSRKSRGSNVLPAAADTVIAVTDKVATVEKQRDGETGNQFPFRLEPFELGIDEDGDVVTTCISVPSDSMPAAKAERGYLTSAQINALDALIEVLADRSKRREAPVALLAAGARMGQYVARIDDWRAQAYSRMGDISQSGRRTQFRRAQHDLQAKGRIQQFEDFVWTP